MQQSQGILKAVVVAMPVIAAMMWCGVAQAAETTPSAASSAGCTLSDPERHTVADVTGGDTLTMTDGTKVRLIGAKAPSAPLAYRGDRPWPLVAEAKQELSALAAGAEVELRFGGTRADRHGNALAHVFVVKGADRIWLQGELVRKGLARVYSFADNHACVAELLAGETEARAKRLGVWGVTAFSVLEAGDVERLGKLTRSYQLVEGVVKAVGEGGSRVYLNFAEDWKSDFTIAIDRKDVAAFKDAGVDPKDFAGKHVRVRGWLEWRNGPMIAVTDVGQIELLPGGAVPAGQAPETVEPGGIAL